MSVSHLHARIRQVNGVKVTGQANQIVPGQKITRITLLGLHFRMTVKGKTRWFGVYECDCGNIIVARAENVKVGHTESCGCLRVDRTGDANRRHGMTGTRLHIIWKGMIGRCGSEGCSNYENYGARGICVCDEWRNSFETFRDWALANGYADNLEIDREDNDGNYEPGNCRWVTRTRNVRNTRRNSLLTALGETKCIADWAEDPRCAVRYSILADRIRSGWEHERAITAQKIH